MKRYVLPLLCLLALAGCKKKNPHDNTREPPPGTDRPAYNHRFDGGETDPYFKPGEGGEGGGEGKGGGGHE